MWVLCCCKNAKGTNNSLLGLSLLGDGSFRGKIHKNLLRKAEPNQIQREMETLRVF